MNQSTKEAGGIDRTISFHMDEDSKKASAYLSDASTNTAGSSPEDEETRTLPEVVERLGFGLAQIRAGLLGGAVYFADGCMLLLVSTLTRAIAKQWAWSSGQRGSVVTIVFLGVMLGNFIGGPIGDSYGRRHLIIASYTGLFACSMLSSTALGFSTVALFCFFMGLSIGIGQPAWNALGAEVTPPKFRIAMQAISQAFFIAGEVYCTVLLLVDDPFMQHLHWRLLIRCACIPSAIFALLASFFLHQSPMYFACRGEYKKAKAVLESMRRDNGAGTVPVDFRLAVRRSELPSRMRQLVTRRPSMYSQRDVLRQLRVVFGPQLRLSTLIVMYSCFVLNLIYFGSLYAFPQVLSTGSGVDEGAAIQLLIGALWELPGQALGIAMGSYLPRVLSIKIYLVLSAASFLCFAACMDSLSARARAFTMLGYYGIKCFVNIGFVMVYQYSIEIYPTEARTTGTAISIGSGRLAGIIAPLVFEAILAKRGSSSDFFYLMLGAIISNLILSAFLRIETQGKALKDDVEEEVETDECSKDPEAVPLLKRSRSLPLVPEPFTPH